MTKQKIWKIYKHTLIIPGNHCGWSYIGQTYRDLKVRFGVNGKNYLYGDTYFSRAIQANGGEQCWNTAWTHEVIEDNITTQEMANLREKYWINYYHTYVGDQDCRGYNLTPGGLQGAGSITCQKIVYCYSLEGNFICQYNSEAEASSSTGVCTSVIATSCRKNKLGIKARGGNYQWSFIKVENIGKYMQKTKKTKIIYQYNYDGTLVNTFKNMIEAHRKTSISLGKIALCCYHKTLTGGGFVWRFEDEQFSIRNKNQSYKPSREFSVVQLSIDDQIITVWKSMTEAARQVGLKSSTGIKGCCDGTRNTAGGYKWKYYNIAVEHNKN